jgi:hypothetical protein
MLCPWPVNAIDAAHMVILLFNHDLELLDAIFSAHIWPSSLVVRLAILYATGESADF